MKSLRNYIFLLFFGIIYDYSYGQLNLNSTLAAGQYYNPLYVNAQPGTIANGNTGVIHLFINNSPIQQQTSYNSQLPSDILSSQENSKLNTSLPVGKTPSTYGVSPTGGATYTVPIVIPPGTMGMVPNLSIAYNSQNVEGFLGYGWGLTGLTHIARMGQTPYHNYGGVYPDQTQAVKLTNADWFALDGNRLIATQGTNGANGTTYATESETFNLITSKGEIGNGPEWFQVQTKNGLTMEYGHSLDSRLVPVGLDTVYSWYIDKITDQFGNYITFHYLNNNGEIHIQRIDYTGNDNAGFDPYNSIIFSYTNKKDANTIYVAGGYLNSSVVLNSIIINSHNTFFKQYSFKYTYNTYTLLQEIDETGADGSTLNPLLFSYASDAPALGSSCGNGPTLLSNTCVQADPSVLGGIADGTAGYSQAAQFTLLDYNGDGKEDVISLGGNFGVPQPLPPCDGCAPQPYYGFSLNWLSQILYTGEGQTPCPNFTQNNYSFPLGFPTSLGSAEYLDPITSTASGSLSQAAQDFNGDGKEDYAISTFKKSPVNGEGADEEEDINIALSTGSSFAASNYLVAYDMDNTQQELNEAAAPAGAAFSGTFYLDMNGDGQLDVFNYHYDPVSQKEYYRVWLNAGSSNTTPQEQPSNSNSYAMPATTPPSPNFEITVSEVNAGTFLDFSKAIPMDLYGDGRMELVNVIQWSALNPNLISQHVILSFNANQVFGQPNYVPEVDGNYLNNNIQNPVPGNGIVIQPDNSNFSYNINTFVNDSTYANYSYNPTNDGAYATYFPVNQDGYDNVFGNVRNIKNNGTPYVQFGDFNGDGITDVLTYNNSNNSWTMNFGKGDGTYAQLPVSTLSADNPFSYPAHYYFAHDVNGDGKTDILEFTPNPNTGSTVINTYYSTGTSFIQGQPITLTGHNINPDTWQFAFGDFNGDGVDDLLLENVIGDGAINGPPVLLYFYSGSHSRRLAQAVDGYKKLVQFYYQPITNSSIYSQPQAANYRSYSNNTSLLDIQPPIYVVSRVTTVDGTGNNTTTPVINNNNNNDFNNNNITYIDTNSTTYSYQDAIYSKLGLGVLGFLNVTSYNTVKDYKTVTTYTVLPQFSNLVPGTYTITAVSANKKISDGAFTYSPVALGGLRYFLTRTKNIVNDDVADVTNTTNYTYDSYGNITDKNSQISVTNANTVETSDVQKTYVKSGTWIPSSVSGTTTNVTYLSNPPYTRSVSNSWDNAGHLISTIMDPSTPEAVTTTNSYDNNTGVLIKQVVSSVDPTCATKTNSFTYDNYSQFKTSSTNSLGQVTHYAYNPLWGKPDKVTTPDGLITTYSYDAYGRSSQIITPDGLSQTFTYQWVTSGELPLGGPDPFSINSTSLYSVSSNKNGSPPLQTFYDWFDRKTLVETSTLSANVFKEQSYDAMGHKFQSTNTYQKTMVPGMYGDYDPVITTNLYNDVKYRLTNVTTTCNSAPTLTTTFTYKSTAGNTTVKTVKPDGSTSSQTTAPTGLMINSNDYVINSHTVYSAVNYNYFSNGHAASVILNGNTVNTFQYDAFGRQTKLNDVNFGANGYTYQYNAYNQLVSQKDPNGNTTTITYDALGRTTQKISSKEGAYTYNYVQNGNGLNQLLSQQLGNNIISYSYDNLRRPLSVNVNGLTTSYTYDAFSHVLTKTYPGSGFSIKNKYSAYGFLTETDPANGPPVWQAEYMNPFGQYVDYVLGNGVHTIKSYTPYDYLTGISGGNYENMTYNFDPTNGNLLSRTEGNLSENFTYDGSLNNRITEAQSDYPNPYTITADITMNYDLNGNITEKSDICAVNTYFTDGNSNNQISEVPNSDNLITGGQTVTYTSFNAPLTLSLGSNSMTFTYGPDNNREQTVLNGIVNNVNQATTRNYATSYENTSVNGGPLTEVNYIQCGGSLVGMYVNTGGNGDMYYVYSDHLGSILTVTDGANNTYNQSFDAWGNYRNPTDGSNMNIPVNPAWLYRGYTGQEHLPQFQLINANGRLYDPLVNNFLSPDVTIQAPTNTQNFNRYSYCLNNPLKYTDPSGFVTEVTANAQWAMAQYNASLGTLDQMNANWGFALNTLDADGFDFPASWDGLGMSTNFIGGGDGGGGGTSGGGGGYSYDNSDNSTGFIPTVADNVLGTNTVTPSSGAVTPAPTPYNTTDDEILNNGDGSGQTQPNNIELNYAVQQFIAIITGESSSNEVEAQAIGDVILNRLSTQGYDVSGGELPDDFLSITSVNGNISNSYNAYGQGAYNTIMGESWSQILSPNNPYEMQIQGAMNALQYPSFDASSGAYFWNATSQQYNPNPGFNWNNYFNGTFQINNQWGGTTFFQYTNTNMTWP